MMMFRSSKISSFLVFETIYVSAQKSVAWCFEKCFFQEKKTKILSKNFSAEKTSDDDDDESLHESFDDDGWWDSDGIARNCPPAGLLNRPLDHAYFHPAIVKRSSEEKTRNEEHPDVGQEDSRVILKERQKGQQSKTGRSRKISYHRIRVSRPGDSNANSQKDDAERHVHIAPIPGEVHADRRDLTAVWAPGESVC